MITLKNNITDYIESNFRVFPLWDIVDGDCSCSNSNCNQAGKHPSISAWQHVPHWSDEQLEVMLEYQCKTGFGVLVQGYLVIDIDPRNGGDVSFINLCNKIQIDLEKECNFVVHTGGDGKHLYFKLDDAHAYIQTVKGYEGIDFKTSGFVVGSGSLHKSGKHYYNPDGIPHSITKAPRKVLDIIRKPDFHRTEHNGEILDITDKDLVGYLSHITPDCEHEQWIRCGMAVHYATQGTGFKIWDDWSSKGSKYPTKDILEKRWHSFGKAGNPVTIGTLIHYAAEGGYIEPVTFEVSEEIEQNTDGLPFDIGNIDLLRPTGLVGELTKWINSQCRYPREHLAVAAALTSLGNIAGMRYTDDKDGISLNLMSLCVAASATGKEAILQSAIEIHSAVNLQPAISGNIKSEQEIVRNLVRHQASYYLVDEIGYLLQKIENARKKGGATYLDGVISTIMAAYSKANGAFLISGDLKDSVKAELVKEMAQCNNKIKENEDESGYFQKRLTVIKERALPEIELGLKNPFLSMMGMTTPVSFDGIITAEQATNGFIGRCLLVRENETNPRRKRGFKKPSSKLPDNLVMTLNQLHGGGDYDVCAPPRIEFYGEKIAIPTENDALEMLEDAADWLEDQAEEHKGKTGFEAIIRRSYEQMAKTSVILAVGEGIRTKEHVRWAFALMKRDMDNKISLAQTNNTEGSATALQNRVLDAAGDGELHSTIIQRVSSVKKYKREDVEKMIKHLVTQKLLIKEKLMHPVTKKPFYRYSTSQTP